MVIIKYETQDEVQALTAAQTALGMHLVAVSNITEGNFLGFDDRDVVTPIPPEQVTMQQSMADQQTIKDGIADLYIAISSIPGVVS